MAMGRQTWKSFIKSQNVRASSKENFNLNSFEIIAHNQWTVERESRLAGVPLWARIFVCCAVCFRPNICSTALAPREGFACAASFVGLPQPHAPHTGQGLPSHFQPSPPPPPHPLTLPTP